MIMGIFDSPKQRTWWTYSLNMLKGIDNLIGMLEELNSKGNFGLSV
jgi:hypothetical protein